MQLSFIFYLFTAFIIVPGTFFFLTQQRRFIAAIVASIGLTILFILFGIQYYTVEGDYNNSPSSMKWPPSINMCPDFLSLYTVGSKPYCVDTAGVSKNGGLVKFNPSNPVVGAATAATNQLFDLHTELSGDARATAIKQECIRCGVTWEGVFDGMNLYTNAIPSPT